MKKRLQGFVAGVLVCVIIGCVGAFASSGWFTKGVYYNDIKVSYNGQELYLSDEPFIMEDRTYLPVRALLESMGNGVKWNSETNTVEVYSDPMMGDVDYCKQVLKLTNDYRAQNGLAELKWDADLAAVGQMHCDDMSARDYFAHKTPEGVDPFQRMDAYGIKYKWAGENLGKGYKTPEEVLQGWIDSPDHRENLLNPNFEYLGVGYNENGNYWAQEFASY